MIISCPWTAQDLGAVKYDIDPLAQSLHFTDEETKAKWLVQGYVVVQRPGLDKNHHVFQFTI